MEVQKELLCRSSVWLCLTPLLECSNEKVHIEQALVKPRKMFAWLKLELKVAAHFEEICNMAL